MKLEKFTEFLKRKTLSEEISPTNAYDRKLLTFNQTFGNDDPKEVENMILSTHRWASVADFIRDENPRKYSFLRKTGSENWAEGVLQNDFESIAKFAKDHGIEVKYVEGGPFAYSINFNGRNFPARSLFSLKDSVDRLIKSNHLRPKVSLW